MGGIVAQVYREVKILVAAASGRSRGSHHVLPKWGKWGGGGLKILVWDIFGIFFWDIWKTYIWEGVLVGGG